MDSARACFCVVEDSASESRYKALLACGLPAQIEKVPTGDAQITVLKSSLDVREPLEAHVAQLLGALDPYDEVLRGVPGKARLSLHLAYGVVEVGGWTFSPELVKALGRWPLEIIVAVEAKRT